ncbi:hypothetical protein VTO73DRAFT_13923 [Trametes versicolor]
MIVCGKADVRKADTEVARRGLNFRVKNISYIVALRGLRADSGAILATTHLFWHSVYAGCEAVGLMDGPGPNLVAEMSASTSAVAEQIIATYQDATSITALVIAVTVLLLYDAILTAGQEYQYIWRSPKTWVPRVLYLWNRYISLLYNLLSLGTIPSISNTR